MTALTVALNSSPRVDRFPTIEKCRICGDSFEDQSENDDAHFHDYTNEPAHLACYRALLNDWSE